MTNHLNVSPSLFEDLTARSSVADVVCSPCETGAHEHCRRRSCACACDRPVYAPKAIPEPFIPLGVELDEDDEASDPLTAKCDTCGAQPQAPCHLLPAGSYHARRRLAAAGGSR